MTFKHNTANTTTSLTCLVMPKHPLAAIGKLKDGRQCGRILRLSGQWQNWRKGHLRGHARPMHAVLAMLHAGVAPTALTLTSITPQLIIVPGRSWGRQERHAFCVTVVVRLGPLRAPLGCKRSHLPCACTWLFQRNASCHPPRAQC